MALERTVPINKSKTASDADERYEQVRNRVRSTPPAFYVAVKTTGIVCLPHCSSRTPLRKNVSFYETLDEARHAGFRPCKRCKPETF